jgi:hypothetical protein
LTWKGLAEAFLAVLVLLAAHCSAVLDGGLGLSADQLIDQSRGDYILPSGMPENPQESRELWSERSGINFSNIAKPPENQSSSTLEKWAASGGSSSQTEVKPAPSSLVMSPAASLEGNWSLQLRDSKNRIMALRLFVSEDAIYGTGTMNDGIETQRVSASGSFIMGNVSLDAVISGDISLYRFNLAKDVTSLSGEYRAFPAEGVPWSGIVQGKRVE